MLMGRSRGALAYPARLYRSAGIPKAGRRARLIPAVEKPVMRLVWNRRGLALAAVLSLAAGIPIEAQEPLPERIDALIDAAAVGPINPPASDADFLRRASLDLTGVIPTAEAARAFLADNSPDKRT